MKAFALRIPVPVIPVMIGASTYVDDAQVTIEEIGFHVSWLLMDLFKIADLSMREDQDGIYSLEDT